MVGNRGLLDKQCEKKKVSAIGPSRLDSSEVLHRPELALRGLELHHLIGLLELGKRSSAGS